MSKNPSNMLLRGGRLIVVCAFAAAAGVGVGTDSLVRAQVLDNKGTDFILSFLPNTLGGALADQVQLHLTGDTPTMVTVEYPVNSPTFVTTVPVNPGNVTIVTLPISAANGWVANTLQNNAVRASASQEFVVYMVNRRTASSDAGLVLPVDALNTEYIAMTYNEAFVAGTFTVYAAFDNTSVTITPSNNIVGHSAGIPFTVTLNRGQGYHASSTSTGTAGSLAGSIITADRPVGLTNGNGCTQVPIGITACDHIFEVAQPVQSWGNEALIVNLPNRPNGTIYRILGSTDNTTVTLNGAFLGMVHRGTFIETSRLVGNHMVAGDNPIFVVQFMTGNSDSGAILGDPAMGNMVPPAQYASRYTFSTVGGSQFAQNFVTVIAEDNDTSTLLLDGAPIGAANFTPIGSTGFSAAVILLSQGTHTTTSNGVHGITIEGYNNFDSYIYPGGARFQFINPVGDANPPVCSVNLMPGPPEFFTGTGTDNRPSEDTNGNGMLDAGEDLNGNGQIDEDTGVFFVTLLPGAVNLALSVAPFIPGDGMVDFTIDAIDSSLPAVGTLQVTDGAGLTCSEPIDQLGTFDPFGGLVRTPSRNLRLTLKRPSPDTEGVRCAETDPTDPDFTGIPFTPFPNGQVDIDIVLSSGDGTKTVCCQFQSTGGDVSDPVCESIELESCTPAPDPDLNNDGRVNILDVSMVSSCIGKDPSSVAKCRVADTDCDADVDINDVRFVSTRFGQTGFPVGP